MDERSRRIGCRDQNLEGWIALARALGQRLSVEAAGQAEISKQKFDPGFAIEDF